MRLFCNLVYTRLAAACPDARARDHLEAELKAPASGWDAAEAALWRRVNAAPDYQEQAG